jgi:hypothetical protein
MPQQMPDMHQLCPRCDADEFEHTETGWVCSNGHTQDWTIIRQAHYRPGMEKRPYDGGMERRDA